MAITAANVDTGSQDTNINNGGTQLTNSVAFQNNRLYIVTWSMRGTAPMEFTSLTGGGITWASVGTAYTSTGANLSWWKGITTSGATTGQLTGTMTGTGPATSTKWVIDEFTGIDVANPIVQVGALTGNANDTVGTVTLSAFADAVNNVAYGVFEHNIQEATTVDASGGWAALSHNQTVVSGVQVLLTEWKTGQDTSVTASWTTGTDRWTGGALEIKMGAAVQTRKLRVVSSPRRW